MRSRPTGARGATRRSRSLECNRQICNNPGVSTVRTVLVSTLLALGAVACAKPSDVPKLQDEATATVARYQPELAQLDRRTDAILAQGNTLPPNLAGTDVAIAALKRARGHIGQLHEISTKAAGRITAAAATVPDEQHPDGPIGELHKIIDESSEHLSIGIREASADLTSVEAWIAQTKYASPVAALDGAPKMKETPVTAPPQPTATPDGTPERAATDQQPPPGVDPATPRH